MVIKLSNSFIKEKEYIIHVLFKVFLGLDYRLETEGEDNRTEILLPNNGIIQIANSLFTQDNDNYLVPESIPEKITYYKSNFSGNEPIPVLFGINEIEVQTNAIKCGIDIFASVFFMLTRWEEYVIKDRDQHNRFPFTSSLAFRHNFLQFPIVNSYVELIWSFLQYLGINQKRKTRVFNIMQTHDIDDIRFWNRPFKYPRIALGDLLFRRNFNQFRFHTKSYIQSSLNPNMDPYNTFNYLMNIAEKHNAKAYFFVLNEGDTAFDKRYKFNNFLKRIILQIQDRGHFIGIHPSYKTYNEESLFSSEVHNLTQFANQRISFGRQHYLRFEIPNTWRIWNSQNMQWDSSMAYSDCTGFRCGTCYEFPVFDILQRKQLAVYEYPLICMDVTLKKQYKGNYAQMLTEGFRLRQEVKKYNGNFVLLWHNSNLETMEWKSYKSIFEQLINNCN